MVTIVDYDIGNLASLKNILKRVGIDAKVATTETDIRDATKIIFPGFGAFDTCAAKLRASGLVDVLSEKVLVEKTPLLGICVGMQLLFECSEEGKLTGLNWIKGRNVRFRNERMPVNYKIPHMGWSDVFVKKTSPLVYEFVGYLSKSSWSLFATATALYTMLGHLTIANHLSLWQRPWTYLLAFGS